jgi:mRNA interferase MazF
VKRGEIWLVELDPTVGSEIKKTRPCLIVSPDEIHDHWRTVIVAPLTTGARKTRFRVTASFQGKSGLILLDQIRTVDRIGLIRPLGRAIETELADALDVLRVMFAA